MIEPTTTPITTTIARTISRIFFVLIRLSPGEGAPGTERVPSEVEFRVAG
jgi:hypothetical protein